MLSALGEEELKRLQKDGELQTHCKASDAPANGGLPTGTITQLFGETALGKSILSLQSAFAAVASGRSAIIVDTEQSYKNYLLPDWQPALSKRFGKEIPVVEATISRETKQSRKKPITRSQLTTMISTALNQAGVLYLECQLSEIADILLPKCASRWRRWTATPQ